MIVTTTTASLAEPSAPRLVCADTLPPLATIEVGRGMRVVLSALEVEQWIAVLIRARDRIAVAMREGRL